MEPYLHEREELYPNKPNTNKIEGLKPMDYWLKRLEELLTKGSNNEIYKRSIHPRHRRQ